MKTNRLIARVLDAVTLLGLGLFCTAFVYLAAHDGAPRVQPFIVWVLVVWTAPTTARLLVIPRGHPLQQTISRYVAYSDAKDSARPSLLMLAARWLGVPLVLTLVFFQLNQRAELVAGGAQALIVIVLFGAFFRGVVELVTALATAIAPARAAAVRRRAERTWNMVYFIGLPLFLLARLSS